LYLTCPLRKAAQGFPGQLDTEPVPIVIYDVIALGELLIDFSPRGVNKSGYPVLSANPGRAPGNTLAALTKYGCRTEMIGKVGDDMFGRLLLGTLRNCGIDVLGMYLPGCPQSDTDM